MSAFYLQFSLKKEKDNIVLGVSSVRPEKYNELINFTVKYSEIKIVNVLDGISKLSDVIRTNVQGYGADRLMGLYGALVYTPAPLFTVDCGTALTINFLDEYRVFRGGAILPGIGSQLRALHNFTEQLPLPGIKKPETYIGTTTETAMLAGVVGGAGGAVRSLVEHMWWESGNQGMSPVLITGGEAAVLLPELRDWFPIQHCPRLVREGIADATRRIIQIEDYGNNA